ncbi:pyrroline-5-carboxylate reductase family protein [Altericroceibacterium endophyticum]|uniref:Pyrroline-5-carboxylate reductase n=1 Tax=Altericroceibacterium endophyticum TaxID=1808508 RepID=A0A6I4T6J4_9SPHN|nr:pyrroline-5-carboxylate reductase [Altericroceibacterium endophyticum]MXO66447.1 pyrroline-5-carboxylate reductase [Altericroceibacterium endophyticum]
MKQIESMLIIGCGNMGGAMLDGWLAAGYSPKTFTVVDPKREELPQGVELLRELPEGRSFDSILLGVKPQMLGDVVHDVEKLAGPDVVMLSILAGVQLDTLAERFPRATNVRVMPNLAVALGKAPVALAAKDLPEADQAVIKTFMDPLGTPEWIDESDFDLVTALAGSGPGFVYRFIDALAKGATAQGLPADQAERLAVAMVEGASALAADSPHNAGELARRVASPGGVTQAGLDVLDDGEAINKLMENTLATARDRSLAMAEEARSGD